MSLLFFILISELFKDLSSAIIVEPNLFAKVSFEAIDTVNHILVMGLQPLGGLSSLLTVDFSFHSEKVDFSFISNVMNLILCFQDNREVSSFPQ